MRAYIIRRLLLVIPTLFIPSILVFLSVRFIPGDVIDHIVANTAFLTFEVDRAAVERMLGLDVPVYVQYGRWLGGVFLHGTYSLRCSAAGVSARHTNDNLHIFVA